MLACHAGDPGSIPGERKLLLLFWMPHRARRSPGYSELQKSRRDELAARNGARLTLRAIQTGQVGPEERATRPGAREAHGRVACATARHRGRRSAVCFGLSHEPHTDSRRLHSARTSLPSPRPRALHALVLRALRA